MRVGIIALLHESNTFMAEATGWHHFEQDLLLFGEAVRDRLAHVEHEVGGFFEGLAQAGIEAVPLCVARALPFGAIDARTYNRLLALMIGQLAVAGPIDGILAAPHGAAVSEEHHDVDGHWLTILREHVGPQIPIISTIDPHANLTPAMVAACDATIAYRSNPHLDQKQRGLEAAALMARTLRGDIRPVQAAAFPPMAINIEKQLTTEPPCAPLYALANAMLQQRGVLSNSIVLGYPYADVPEMGSSVIVVTDRDPQLAQRLADELAVAMWERREQLAGNFIDVDTALDQAEVLLKTGDKLPGAVCLLDMGDNMGGGSSGDSTFLAHALHRRHRLSAFVGLYDPQSVQQVAQAGTGRRVTLRAGGKTDNLHGEPLEAIFTVMGLYDGKYEDPQVSHGGYDQYDQGTTAVVCTDDGLTIMLMSLRALPLTLQSFAHCQLDPASFQLIVAKGVNSPVAAYTPVCSHFIRVNTLGATCADMTQLHYQHRRRPMIPFESQIDWSPTTLEQIRT